MSITLWGRLNSINVQKVVWCLHETGQPFERIDAGRGVGVNDTPAYLAMNPNGLVPTLREGDFVLWESNAIVRYLATKFCHGSLAPSDPRAFADADRWLDWQATALNPVMGPAFHGLVRAPGSRGVAEVEASCAKTEAAMDILEHHPAWPGLPRARLHDSRWHRRSRRPPLAEHSGSPCGAGPRWRLGTRA